MIRLAIAATATVALSATGLAAAAGSADVFTYRSTLTAKAEVPKPKAPTGAGGLFTAKVAKNGTSYTISWKLTYRKLSGPAVAAHIHRGRAGVAGGVLLPLCGPCRSGQAGRATISKALAEAMRKGTAYVNVHTAKNAGGEIRGQAKLTGTSIGETPAPPPPPPTETEPPPPYDPY